MQTFKSNLRVRAKPILWHFQKGVADKCSRRHGVRKKRKDAKKRATFSTGQIPVFAEDDAENFGILSPTQSSDTAATLTTAASTQQSNCYIANESILSYDLPSEQELSDVIGSRTSIFESLLRDNQIAILPRPALLRALKDGFVEHVAPFYPILDSEDVFSDSTPMMLQLAICWLVASCATIKRSLSLLHLSTKESKA